MKRGKNYGKGVIEYNTRREEGIIREKKRNNRARRLKERKAEEVFPQYTVSGFLMHSTKDTIH